MYLTQIVSEILSRNPSDNCRLESTAAVLEQIQLPATKMEVRLHYKDILGNEYDPIDRTVELIDKRNASGNVAVEIPLKWTVLTRVRRTRMSRTW